jgi:ADP-ribose pyrophosphatase YjhB (NUDIX family)
MDLSLAQSPVFAYRDSGFAPKETFLPKEEYEQVALAKLVIACADIVITGPEEGVIYLARRIAEPCAGWWVIGGRQRIDQTSIEAAQAHLHRDIGLSLEQNRFQFLGLFEYLADTNLQGTGISHTLAATYLVKLTEQELVMLFANGTSARPDEYEPGIHAFDQEALETLFAKGELHDAIRRMYHLAFPHKKESPLSHIT